MSWKVRDHRECGWQVDVCEGLRTHLPQPKGKEALFTKGLQGI